MGIRIHTTIGWALPYEKAEKYSPLYEEGGKELYEKIDNILSAISYLNISKDEADDLQKRTKQFILLRDLLNPEVRQDGIPKTQFKATELCKNIYEEPEGITHLVFYPNLYLANQWFRFDDSLDYALFIEKFESGEETDNIKYIDRNHYPYRSYMDENGSPLDEDQIFERRYKTKEPIIPAVPAEIRWWVEKTGILTNEGINQLRPIIAHWWS